MNSQHRKDSGFADHRRDRERGRLVYPVMSRRSEGLSLGINLFPDAKTCSFDCPYCEVFPFAGALPFSVDELRHELSGFLDRDWQELWAPEPIRDLCISGNGEPSLSPALDDAVSICSAARRDRPDLLGPSRLVIITNGTGFLRERSLRSLARAQDEGFELWAKLDAGDQGLFAAMSGTALAFTTLLDGLRSYAATRQLTIQTMFCEVEGHAPDEREFDAYARTILSLLEGGARIPSIQLYTLARPASGRSCRALADEGLRRLGTKLTSVLGDAGRGVELRVYGSQGRLFPRTERR